MNTSSTPERATKIIATAAPRGSSPAHLPRSRREEGGPHEAVREERPETAERARAKVEELSVKLRDYRGRSAKPIDRKTVEPEHEKQNTTPPRRGRERGPRRLKPKPGGAIAIAAKRRERRAYVESLRR